jgi:hypothetical protein
MIRIVQCLCPKRHAIMAFAYDSADIPEHFDGDPAAPRAGLKQLIEDSILAKMLDPWCGICRAPASEFRYEDCPSRFRTMDEARPVLTALASANAEAREILHNQIRSASRN